MINFINDYNSPGHPAVIQAIAEAAGVKYPGYGTDDVCNAARQKIASLLGAQNSGADVHFLVGGTQTNFTAIGAFLRPHEAVIAPDSSHIQVHETGAIEAVGHRILMPRPNPSAPGKISAGDVRLICKTHDNEHMVKPRLVYISQSTELGGVYSLAELRALRAACDDCGLLLYVDGARLAAALTSPVNDAALPDLASLCDAFYLGGTKNGLLFGEALVVMNPALKDDFRYHQKQRGGLLAKGFLLGLQFLAIFENDLYFSLAAHANQKAERLRTGLQKLDISFLVDSGTNQIFPILSNETVAALEKNFQFETWAPVDGQNTAVRFVTSWNTTDDEVGALLTAIRTIKTSPCKSADE